MAVNKKDKAPTKREMSANNYVAAVTVGLILAVILTGFVGKYLGSAIVLNTKVIVKKQKAVSQLDTKLGSAPQLIDEYNNLGAKATLIDDSLPTTDDFPQLVAIMDGMGAASGVQIKSVSPGDAFATTTSSSSQTTSSTTTPSATDNSTASLQPSTTSFSVAASGSYASVISLLKNVEQSSRPMRVTSVDFAGTNASLTADIGITTYYQAAADVQDKTEVVK